MKPGGREPSEAAGSREADGSLRRESIVGLKGGKKNKNKQVRLELRARRTVIFKLYAAEL
jgi:hypothetical protein